MTFTYQPPSGLGWHFKRALVELKILRNKVRLLFGRAPPVPWMKEIDYRDNFNSPRPAMTILQAYEILGEAIRRGEGGQGLSIELEFVQGQLCGLQRAPVASIHAEEYRLSSSQGALVVRPSISLIHFQKSGFEKIMQFELAQGPWT